MNKSIRQYRIAEYTRKINSILLYIAVKESEGLPVFQRDIAAVTHLQNQRYQYFTISQKLVWNWTKFKLNIKRSLTR